ncbi:MAG: caspase family protein, partial [Anaerolineae bacterium]|nr:caspase family protein [Thermoflexales bacterium]MDW8408397.1 caspase family protein [Anaerolineae bacterium]
MPDQFTHGYALVIGIAGYPHITPLPINVLNDAADMAAMLKRADRAGYPADHVRILLDDQASKQAILDGLRWLTERTDEDSTAVVFFSGHGARVVERGAPANYLLPYHTQVNALRDTAIRSDELTQALSAIRAGRLVVILDACHSGGTGEAKDALAPEAEAIKGNPSDDLYEELRQGNGRVILASSKSVELSYVLPNARNSLFTQCLLEGMDGKARHRGDGTVRIFDLAEYVMEEVPARYHRKQHPIFKAQDVDANFPVALLMGGDKSLVPTPPLTPLTTSVDRTALR